MHASSLLVLAVGAMSASAAYGVQPQPETEQHSTTTSTSTMTHFVTITKCNPTNTLCPLYTPSATSSPVASTTLSTSATPTPTPSSSSASYPVFTPPPAPALTSSSLLSSSSPVPVYSVKSYPANNSTASVFPTAFYNTTTPKYTAGTPTPATLTSAAGVPTTPVGGGSSYPTAPAPSPIPTGGAASLQSAGLMMGVMGAVAALLL